jgi:hypothetical protein
LGAAAEAGIRDRDRPAIGAAVTLTDRGVANQMQGESLGRNCGSGVGRVAAGDWPQARRQDL